MRRSRITIKIVALLVSLFRKEGTRQIQFHLNEGLEGCLVSTAEIFLRSKINPFLTRIRLNSPLSSPLRESFPSYKIRNSTEIRIQIDNWLGWESLILWFSNVRGNIRMEMEKLASFCNFIISCSFSSRHDPNSKNSRFNQSWKVD